MTINIRTFGYLYLPTVNGTRRPSDTYEVEDQYDCVYSLRKSLKKIDGFWESRYVEEVKPVYAGRIAKRRGTLANTPYLWMEGFLPDVLATEMTYRAYVVHSRKMSKNYTLNASLQHFARMGIRITKNGPYHSSTGDDGYYSSRHEEGNGKWLTPKQTRVEETEFKAEGEKND